MAKTLYIDCFSGASGDMILGALLDLGLPLDELRRALGSLGVAGYSLEAERVLRSGISATHFTVRESAAETVPTPSSHGHVHDHDHGAHGDHGHRHDHAANHFDQHRSLVEIHGLIDKAGLSASARARSHELFDRLAQVEAEIHQIPVEQIHLHEVGALDSIIDIVGIVFGLEWLGAEMIVASPLNVGGGSVKTAHGVLSVPAPATARLLQGIPVYSSGAQVELVTPTGALVIAAYAHRFGPLPAMRVRRIGYGAGTREVPGSPNVIRLMVGEDDAAVSAEEVVVMECEIDDMNPQLYGALMDRLYAVGALEVFYTAVQMKKNRPGTLVTVVAPPAKRDEMAATLFRDTTTIGLRHQTLARECLDREIVPVTTAFGVVRFKVARRGGVVMNASPEFEDCARLAIEHAVSPKEVQAVAIHAYRDRIGAQAPHGRVDKP
jgi:uncharacterized protein (TIGR00299 family) protein